MGLLPRMDALALTGLLCCRDGHEAGMLLMAPVEQRSLRVFEETTHGMRCPPCPECGAPMELRQLSFEFDEPGLPELSYDSRARSLTCDGEPVSSEQDLVERIGRPFSLADYHRSRLVDVTDTVAYQASAGVVVAATPCEPDDGDQEIAARMLRIAKAGLPLMKADLETRPSEHPAMPIPLGWHRDIGRGAWAGPAGERISQGALLVQSLVRVDLLLDALASYEPKGPERSDPPLQVDVKVGDQGLEPWVRLDSLATMADVERYAEYTFTKALTLHEAAAYAYSDLAGLLSAIRDALHDVDAELLAGWRIEEGPVLVRGDSEDALSFDLEDIARQVGLDVNAITARVSERLTAARDAAPGEPLGDGRLPCGCELAWAVMLRPSNPRSREFLHQPFIDDTVVCVAGDCEHHTAYLPNSMPEEQAAKFWQLVRDGMRTQAFELDAKPIRELDGALIGAVVMGHNAATPACDGPLTRSLAAACCLLDDDPDGELTVICATINLAVVGRPGADRELLGRELAAVARDAATHQHVQAAKLPLTITHRARGERYGTFRLGELVAHPIDRIMNPR